MEEVKPAFGVATEDLESAAGILFIWDTTYSLVNGITNYGRSFESLMEESSLWLSQARTSDVTNIFTLLFEGKLGCGKSSIVSTLALKSGFPFVKLLNAEKLIGHNEIGKIGIIHKLFLDAHKSPESIVILDDLERILEYSPIGHQYSNGILQTLLVLLRKAPSKGKRLMILCTTSSAQVLQMMGITQVFDAVLSIPNIVSAEEIVKVVGTEYIN